MSSSAKSLNNLCKKKALRYLYDEYTWPYDKALAKSGKVTLKARKLRTL